MNEGGVGVINTHIVLAVFLLFRIAMVWRVCLKLKLFHLSRSFCLFSLAVIFGEVVML